MLGSAGAMVRGQRTQPGRRVGVLPLHAMLRPSAGRKSTAGVPSSRRIPQAGQWTGLAPIDPRGFLDHPLE